MNNNVAYIDVSDNEAFMLWIKFHLKNTEVCFEGVSPKLKGLVTPFDKSPALQVNWNWIKPPKNNVIWREQRTVTVEDALRVWNWRRLPHMNRILPNTSRRLQAYDDFRTFSGGWLSMIVKAQPMFCHLWSRQYVRRNLPSEMEDDFCDFLM